MPSETNNKISNSKMIGRWRMIESKYSEILEFYEYLVALGKSFKFKHSHRVQFTVLIDN